MNNKYIVNQKNTKHVMGLIDALKLFNPEMVDVCQDMFEKALYSEAPTSSFEEVIDLINSVLPEDYKSILKNIGRKF